MIQSPEYADKVLQKAHRHLCVRGGDSLSPCTLPAARGPVAEKLHPDPVLSSVLVLHNRLLCLAFALGAMKFSPLAFTL